MANPQCASGDGAAAVFIGTYLETGDTVALCDECFVAWTAAMLQSMTGVDPAPFLQAISEGDPVPPEGPGNLDGGGNSATPAGPGPPKRTRKRGPTSNGSREAGMDADHPDADAASSSTPETPAA